eukprot:g4947.t1
MADAASPSYAALKAERKAERKAARKAARRAARKADRKAAKEAAASSSSAVAAPAAADQQQQQQQLQRRQSSPPLDWIRSVVAPMVGCSDLAFRMLCRRHGATVAYSQMYLASSVAADKDGTGYRREFQTLPEDRPLVVQLAGDDPTDLLAAAKFVQDRCDAIDINLGCPQKKALEGHYGAYMTGKDDWPLLRKIVKTLVAGLKVPVFCKVRLQPTLEESIELCTLLQESGAALIAVHGRGAGTPTERRTGAADLKSVAAIKKALAVPVITNGNVRHPEDVNKNLKETACDGIMVAEAILSDPGLFSEAARVAGGGAGEVGAASAAAPAAAAEVERDEAAESSGGSGQKRKRQMNDGDGAAVAARALLPASQQLERRKRIYGLALEYFLLFEEVAAAGAAGAAGSAPAEGGGSSY